MDTLAQICDRIAARSSRNRKIAILKEYFATLSDADLALAVRFLTGEPLASSQTLFGDPAGRTLSIGGATLRDATVAATGWDSELFRICRQESGDTGEAISLLMTGRTAGRELSLATAADLYAELMTARTTARKVELLTQCFTAYRPLTIKYFVKVITGNLRIGLQTKMVHEALGENHSASPGAGPQLFQPLDFMLAKPLEAASGLPDPGSWMVEDKYDGIRSQVHFADGRVAIYSRGMDEITKAFPELQAALAQLTGSGVIDGEVLGWRGERALPFTLLQQRVARKKVTREIIDAIPVAFVGYDILNRNGESLLQDPIEQRRAALVATLEGVPHPVRLSPQCTVAGTSEIEQLFEESRLRGNEGLLLKRRGSLYEPGKRSGSWFKLKRAFATLDVVITAAEQGHGKRATMLSDYTFAVRTADRYVNIGKAYSGLTDPEVRELTRLLRSLSTEKFGRVTLVRPEVVLEVAFDGVQKSARHKSGYALRFPRIVRWRRDKAAADSDDLERVASLYESSLNLTASREGQ